MQTRRPIRLAVLLLFVLGCTQATTETLSGELVTQRTFDGRSSILEHCVDNDLAPNCAILAESANLASEWIDAYTESVDPCNDLIRTQDQVKILDAAGVIVGLGSLTIEESQVTVGDASGPEVPTTFRCVQSFTAEISTGSRFYSIEVGPRAGPTWSDEELENSDWNVNLVLDES